MTIVTSAHSLFGLSTDAKPTDVPVNRLFFETDTLKQFYFNGAVWEQLPQGITGLNPNSTILEYSTTLSDYFTPSSATATSGTPNNAIDGNISTFWQSDAGINESITLNAVSSFDITDLKTYWKFNESGGADLTNFAGVIGSAESLGAGADGQNTNVTQGAIGIINEAYSYNGTTSFTQLGSSLSQFNFLHDTSALFTINIWVKLKEAIGTTQRIWSTYAVSGGRTGMDFTINNTGKIACTIQNATGAVTVYAGISTGDYPDDQEWHMISTTFDLALGSNNGVFYIDGVAAGTGTKTGNAANAGNAQHEGHLASSGNESQFANIDLDEVSIFNRVLSAPEIASLYNSGVGLALGTASSGNVFALAYYLTTSELATMTETQFQIKAGTQVLRTINKTDLVAETYNYIRFNGVNTDTITVEGSSGNSLVMVANELALQSESDPPLTTLHGQFSINGTDDTLPLDGGDPTTSLIDDPQVNTITFNNVLTPNDPELEKGLMWLETADGNNNIINAKVKFNGVITTFQIVPPTATDTPRITAPSGSKGNLTMTNDGRMTIEPA